MWWCEGVVVVVWWCEGVVVWWFVVATYAPCCEESKEALIGGNSQAKQWADLTAHTEDNRVKW